MKLARYQKFKVYFFVEMAKLRKNGFISFVFSTTLSRAISFLSIMFLARVLTKSDYGLLSYVDNLRNYILIVNGLGMTNVILRYCAKSDDSKANKGYLYVSLVVGTIFDILLIIVSLLFYFYGNFDYANSNQILISLSLLPVFLYVFESLQMYFRATFRNYTFSVLSVLYSLLMVSLQVLLGFFFGITGIVLGRYLSLVLVILVSIVIFIKQNKYISIYTMPLKEDIKKMIFLGISFLIAGASSSMIIYNETIILSNFIKDEIVLADFKAASLILQITYFFVNSIVLFVFPYFVKNHEDKKWISRNYIKLSVFLILLMLPVHVILFILMEYVIKIIFGLEYITAVPIARLILFSSLVQTTFRIPIGNVLIAIGKEKINLIVNIFGVIIHIFLTYQLVSTYSINGAIFSTLIIYTCTSIVMFYYFNKHIKEG